MARYGEALERDAGDLDRLTAREQVFRRVRTSRDARRRKLRESLEPFALALRHPDLGPRALGEVGDTAEVIEMPVRDEDPCAGRAEPRELEAKVGRIAAR